MTFEQMLTVGWRDLDANAHMANTAYLDKSVDVRIAYMSSRGIPMAELRRRQVGPFAMRDELEYRDDLAAQVLTLGAWVDLTQRKLIAPDEDLRDVWRSLDQTEDFEVLPSLVR